MAVVECGLCGWYREVDETLSDFEIDWQAVKAYSEHMLEDHPALARADGVVRYYISTIAAVLAPRNGAVMKNRD